MFIDFCLKNCYVLHVYKISHSNARKEIRKQFYLFKRTTNSACATQCIQGLNESQSETVSKKLNKKKQQNCNSSAWTFTCFFHPSHQRGPILLQWQLLWSCVHEGQCISSISETLYYSLFLFSFPFFNWTFPMGIFNTWRKKHSISSFLLYIKLMGFFLPLIYPVQTSEWWIAPVSVCVHFLFSILLCSTMALNEASINHKPDHISYHSPLSSTADKVVHLMPLCLHIRPIFQLQGSTLCLS